MFFFSAALVPATLLVPPPLLLLSLSHCMHLLTNIFPISLDLPHALGKHTESGGGGGSSNGAHRAHGRASKAKATTPSQLHRVTF